MKWNTKFSVYRTLGIIKTALAKNILPLLALLFLLFFLLMKYFFWNQTLQVTIIHTDVLYGKVQEELAKSGTYKGKYVGGSALISSIVNNIRKESKGHSLLVDAGSSFFGGNSLHEGANQGALVVNIMNSMKYDAMTLGNSELDNGVQVLQKVLNQAHFPLLGANVFKEDSDIHPEFIRPYIIKEVNNVKIGVLGLTNPEMEKVAHPFNIKGLHFGPFLTYARKYVKELKQKGVDLIVVLSDLYTPDKEIKLASEFQDDIDLIVATSQYEEVQGPLIRIGRVPIVKTPRKMKSVGRYDIVIDTLTKKIKNTHWRLYPVVMGPDVFPDEKIVRIIEDDANILKTHLIKRVLGQSKENMPYETIREGAFGNLVTDILAATFQADISFVNSPNLRGIPIGPITQEVLNRSIPYDDEIFTMTLSGWQIKKILEDSFKDIFFTGILQLSGLKLQYDLSAPVGQRVNNIHFRDEPLDLKRDYTVVTTSYLAAGGDQFLTFKDGLHMQGRGVKLRKVVSDYIAKVGQIQASVDGRMTEVPAEPKSKVVAK